MYNKPLEYLLKPDPKDVLSPIGIKIRQAINPVFRAIAPFTGQVKFKILEKAELPKNVPLIFAPTHGFKDDTLLTVTTIGVNAYIFMGSLPQMFHTFDGYTAWLNGMILVDRSNKESRRTGKEKMIYAINNGANILMFPEGVWNKSPNLLLLKLFPGIYDVAKETGAWIVPIGTHIEEGIAYSVMDEAFDIAQYDREEGMAVLRDKLATLKWDLIERFSVTTRDELLNGMTPDEYWNDFLEKLIATADFYDYEVENNAEYKDKRITSNEQAFEHLKSIKLNSTNAFLFNKSHIG